SARGEFLEAIRIARELTDDGVPRSERLLLDGMHMMGIAAEGEEANQWNVRALELARRSSDESVASWEGPLLNNLGWNYFDDGAYDEALDYLEQSLTYRESRGEQGPIWIARYSVARVWRALERCEEALGEQSALRAELEAAESTDFPYSYATEEIGWNLKCLGRDEEAVPFLEEALSIHLQDEWTVENEPDRIHLLREALGQSETDE
ncbi:MAG: tetratricopeptide repeat protein, partial [Myxococcales bacterium]|nr:tetratricopeptide repeat protein [Myxococcales bacterium]